MDFISQESFDRCCRLCAEEQEVTIMIFSAEAEAMLLPNKLNKYLLIEIDENDRLPKNICLKCCSKLQTVCDFIDNARKSQKVLMNQSILLEQMTTKTGQVDEEPNNVLEERLGQHYQTQESIDDSQHVMEISVDPMMITRNIDSDNEDSNQIESEQHNQFDVKNETEVQSYSEDVSYLHGLDGENVTIKLIKRNDQESDHVEPVFESTKEKLDLKPFPCIICKRSFLTELALKNHSWIHVSEDKNGGKQFKCYTCSIEFDYRCDLIVHLKEHRSRSTCNVCARTSEGNLLRHMVSHNSPFNNHPCKICGRSYNTLSNLKTHSITHSNERPFKCHLCKKCFKRNQDLKFHINQHTGAKPYKCPFCDKSFASSGNCYSHRSRMHPGRRLEPKPALGRRRAVVVPTREYSQPRPIAPKTPLISVKGIYKYQCTMCEHSFMKRDNFTYHMFQHTGKKPFECSFCKEKFVTRRGLLIHHDRKHPLEERPLALISKNVLLN